jgi:hypothetical protein
MNTLDFKAETLKNIDKSKLTLEADKIKLEALLKCITTTISDMKIEHEYRCVCKHVIDCILDTAFTIVSVGAGFWLLSQILDNIF